MAGQWTITKQPDGDVSLGSWNGELMTLQPGSSDYSNNGYLLVDGVSVVNNSALANLQNVDLYKILAVIPVGGQGGYVPVLNPVTKRVQVFRQTAATGALAEVPTGTDLSAQPFNLLIAGQ